ncbi:MAG: hypothetical protein ACREFY_20510 [Acetobacteraceae bacterium]
MPGEAIAVPGIRSDAEAGRLERFVAALLAEAGALVEPAGPDGLEVLAPQAVRDALGVGDLVRFGFGAAVPEDAVRIGIESDWLDRFAVLLGPRGRGARVLLDAPARAPSDPERTLGHELVLDNATFRLLGVAPAWTRYLVFAFRTTAVSDEQREGLLHLPLNLATGAVAETVLPALAPLLPGLAEAGGLHPADVPSPDWPDPAVLPADWEWARILDLLRRAVPPRVTLALAPFLRGLRRRFERDQERLHSYHNDLHRESLRRADGIGPDDPAREREVLRRVAIGREYRARIEDLSRQYALRVGVEWSQTLEIVCPVQRFSVLLRRRKAERRIELDWNPLARRLEAPACATGAAERPRLLCDDALHLLAPAGLAPCPNCARPFCRACHARCPRCGAA